MPSSTKLSERLTRQGEEAQLRLAAIVQSSNDAILSIDLDGIITSWNAAAERIFGFSEAEVMGQSIAMLVSRIDVPLTFSPLRDMTGRLVGASGIVRDITEAN